jgi:hypothetical protein
MADGVKENIKEAHYFLAGLVRAQMAANPYYFEITDSFPVHDPRVEEI